MCDEYYSRMTHDEALHAIREATEGAIAELKRLNTEKRVVYDRLFHDLEVAKIRDLERKIAGGKTEK